MSVVPERFLRYASQEKRSNVCYNFPMKAIANIILWTVLFDLISVLILCNLTPLVPIDAVPRIYWSGCLFDLEKRLEEYKESGARNVIVGPSYAKQIGSFGSVRNLALDAAFHPEIAFVVEHYCTNADIIFYVLTARELSPFKPRTKSMHVVPRRLMILKDAFHKVALGVPVAKGRAESEPCSAKDLDLFKEAADISRLNNKKTKSLETSIRKIKNNPEIDPDELTLEPLESLFQRHSNIIFVLHPTLPLRPVNDSSPFGKQINRWARANQKLKTLFYNSSLPFIDLTDTEPWEFSDWRHLSKTSSKNIPKYIEEAISARKASSRHDRASTRGLEGL